MEKRQKERFLDILFENNPVGNIEYIKFVEEIYKIAKTNPDKYTKILNEQLIDALKDNESKKFFNIAFSKFEDIDKLIEFQINNSQLISSYLGKNYAKNEENQGDLSLYFKKEQELV